MVSLMGCLEGRRRLSVSSDYFFRLILKVTSRTRLDRLGPPFRWCLRGVGLTSALPPRRSTATKGREGRGLPMLNAGPTPTSNSSVTAAGAIPSEYSPSQLSGSGAIPTAPRNGQR